MTDIRQEWSAARDELVTAIQALGFPAELGELCAKELGSPNAIHRMTSYLYHVRPKKAELIADELISICSETAAWHEKKAAQQANASYTAFLNADPDDEDSDGYDF